MVHVYIINLDRDVERWKKIQEQFSMFNSTLFIPQRIPAVLGNKLDIKNMPNVSVRTKACIDEPRCGHESIGTLNEIGCYLSHYNTWKEFLKTNEEYGIVCEDDVIFDKKILNIDSLYQKIKKSINSSTIPPIAIFISTLSIFYDKKNIADLPDLWRVTGRFFGTGCYLINKPMANYIIQNAFPIEVQVDSYLAFLAKINKNLYMYHIKEPYALLTNDKSTIEHTDCKGCYLPVSRNMVVFIGIVILALFVILITTIFVLKRNKIRELSKM